MVPAVRRAYGCLAASLLLAVALPANAQEELGRNGALDLVAVAIVDHGRAILLATPGLQKGDGLWRFRSLDTSELPQPIDRAVLATSGTKLFLQGTTAAIGVLDLTRQHRYHAALQYVPLKELALSGTLPRSSHRLPVQRFVAIRHGVAEVIDDRGEVQPDYARFPAVQGAISEDGSVLYVGLDGTLTSCERADDHRSNCRELAGRVDPASVSVMARAVSPGNEPRPPRFLLIETGADGTMVIDPEGEQFRSGAIGRTEAAFRACLRLHGWTMSEEASGRYVTALIRESARTVAGRGRPIADWLFFGVVPDEQLYAPVLEFSRLETVFPSAFETLERLAPPAAERVPYTADTLYDRYLRQEPEERQSICTFYFFTRSTPGSWLIEYWLYYPFDVGGLGSHLHDPEHFFVEVDKLGGTVRRVIGAGHGYMAGNNVYSADKPGAHPLDVPLFAIVELGKHATAPDVDRDGVFTPGVDENEYHERAKIWGIRDVIGTINNQVLSYDNTMSSVRRPEDWLPPAVFASRFPGEAGVTRENGCRVTAVPFTAPEAPRPGFHVSDWVILPPCHDYTSQCAERHVTSHPDFQDPATILKEWAFPESFLRATYGVGPHRGLHSIALGYAMDLNLIPGLGRALPLPGRLGGDVFYWHENAPDPERQPCIGDCEGVGWAVRYQQFLSNLFGIFSAVRVYTPPFQDAWMTFGPFVETPLGKHTNVAVEGGLSFPLHESPQFELRISVGLWKPKTNHLGLHAGSDDSRKK